MKSRFHKIVILIVGLVAASQNTFAQVYGPGIFGYWPTVFNSGNNLFSNPFQSGSNTLSSLFPANVMPAGTTVSFWNSTTATFNIYSTFTNGAWTTNLTLPPGTGVSIFAPSSFTNTIAGYIENHDGSLLTNENLTIPPVFSGSNGLYLLGDKTPITDTGTNIFLNILGRLPFVGEQVIKLTSTNTYLGNGTWDSVPSLGVSEAAFLNVISEMPPMLTIAYSNGLAVVSWPSYALDWTLQTNANLSTSSWGKYVGAVVNNTVTNIPNGNLFFRLSYL